MSRKRHLLPPIVSIRQGAPREVPDGVPLQTLTL